MPLFTQDDVSLYYEEYGSGFPVLLFAPGGMLSAISYWEEAAWNPITELAPHFRVIAMDQRNAGRSTAPIAATDGWHTYTADHLALAKHLGLERFHVVGGCIGGPYCLGVMQAESDRVASAILQQSIGFDDNRETFHDMFDEWADPIRSRFPHMSAVDWNTFRGNMYDGDFVFNVDRDFVRSCAVPMLVLMGTDVFHPESTSRELAALAPDATLIEQWKDPARDDTVRKVVDFLKAHTPS